MDKLNLNKLNSIAGGRITNDKIEKAGFKLTRDNLIPIPDPDNPSEWIGAGFADPEEFENIEDLKNYIHGFQAGAKGITYPNKSSSRGTHFTRGFEAGKDSFS